MKKVVILGSTGSIGVQALEVISKNMTKYKVIGLAAGNNTELLLKQIEEFKPKVVAALDEEGLKAISEKHKGIDFNVGQEGIQRSGHSYKRHHGGRRTCTYLRGSKARQENRLCK